MRHQRHESITARATSAILALLVGAVLQAHAQDLTRGRQLYQLCGACHGEDGHGSQLHNAPAIAGLAPWYAEAQLQKFKDGWRGYHADDAAALQMRPMVRVLKSTEDLKAVAAYVAALPPAQPTGTVTGDIARGKDLYVTCTACHGQVGEGNEAIRSPALTHQTDWYLVSQLKKFRDGLRGAHKDDASGVQMRAMTMMLQDDQALNDIAAYVLTLGK